MRVIGPMEDSKKRFRNYCFTLNNYTQEDIENVDKFDCTYMLYSKEIAPTTGTPHLQGYLEMKEAKTMKSLCKKIPRCSFFVAKGDHDDQLEYISKKHTQEIFERGTPKKQGERKDLDAIKDDIMNGLKVDDIIVNSPTIYHQYGRTLSKIEDIRMRKVYRKEMTKGVWYYGETRTGKSELAFKDYNPDTHYTWKYDGDWQDGYVQQDTVIIDEFRGQIPYSTLLTLIDKHPNASVRRRGREPLPFVSKMVIITSSLHPREVYHNLSENDKMEQLFRRIEIIKLEKNT